MKKTLIIATAAGLAMSTGIEETQDNQLFMNSIKNGYYTVSNAILSRPAMIAGGMQMIQNGMARPTFINHFDEVADDNFAVDDFQDDNLALQDAQDDELFLNSIKNGYYTVSNAILSRPAMIAGGMQMIQNGMARPTFINHFDEVADDNLAIEDFQDDNLALEDAQDDELLLNSIKNGYYTVSNAILSRPAMIAGGMQMIQNGMARPTFLNHFDEATDDNFAVENSEKKEGHEKSKKPQGSTHRRRRPIERPDDVIKRNTKLRVPKEAIADNTLFDLAELIEDN